MDDSSGILQACAGSESSYPTHGPNTDGINPDSCEDVLIEKCSFSTGDDCIAINSGLNEDGMAGESSHADEWRCATVCFWVVMRQWQSEVVCQVVWSRWIFMIARFAIQNVEFASNRCLDAAAMSEMLHAGI